MKFKLAIANVITFAVIGKIAETPTQSKNFNFKLTCSRLNQDEVLARMKDEGESIKEFLLSVTTGWQDQRLVLNEDDTPADFSSEALEEMFKVAGMPMYLYNAYVQAVLVKEKN